MRRNITSWIRRNSRMPIQVPISTAGAHQRNVFPVSTSKMPSFEKYARVATCMIRMMAERYRAGSLLEAHEANTRSWGMRRERQPRRR